VAEAAAELRSALIVAVPEAASAVDRWREQTCQAKPSTGVPAHITILWPFLPSASIDGVVLDSLQTIFSVSEEFAFELRATARFPGTLYLAPEPADRFTEITRAVWDAFPSYPPYEGVFDTVVPHLTTAQGDDDVLAEAESAVRSSLPIAARAREVLLIEEVEPEGARWQPRATFPLRNS
jgi:2'-5' RNA ligase